MKCSKCGFTSFDSLDTCRKCGRDLTETKARLGFLNPAFPPPAPEAANAEEEECVDEGPAPEAEQTVSFDFDFMEGDAPFEFETEDDDSEAEPVPFDEPEDTPLNEPEDDPFAGSAQSWTGIEERAEDSPPTLLRRGFASAVDLAILALVFTLFLAAGEISDGGGLLPSPATLTERSAPYFLVLFSVCFGYFTLFHFLTGQPPGKMLLGLRVENKESGPLTLSQAFLRSVGGLLSVLPAGLGYLGITCDGERRGWNDRIAGTRVVRELPREAEAETSEG